MSKLSVLGAQRIKALSEMIDEQCRNEIEKESKLLTKSEAIKIVMSDVEFKQYNNLSKKYEETIDKLNEFTHLTGNHYMTHVSTGRNSKSATLINKDTLEKRTKQKEIKAKHDKRKQMLWLCETLEEAKEIVGI